jgi:phosphatidylserine decarboxylase
MEPQSAYASSGAAPAAESQSGVKWPLLPAIHPEGRKWRWPSDPEGRKFGITLSALFWRAGVEAARLADGGHHRSGCLPSSAIRCARRRPGQDLVIAPADGLVTLIPSACRRRARSQGRTASATRLMTRVSIFMSVFDVHINRTPISGHGPAGRLYLGQVHQRRSRQGERGQ